MCVKTCLHACVCTKRRLWGLRKPLRTDYLDPECMCVYLHIIYILHIFSGRGVWGWRGRTLISRGQDLGVFQWPPAQPASSSLVLHPLPSFSEALTHKPKKIYSMLAPASVRWLPNKVKKLKAIFHSRVAVYIPCYNTGMWKPRQKCFNILDVIPVYKFGI